MRRKGLGDKGLTLSGPHRPHGSIRGQGRGLWLSGGHTTQGPCPSLGPPGGHTPCGLRDHRAWGSVQPDRDLAVWAPQPAAGPE